MDASTLVTYAPHMAILLGVFIGYVSELSHLIRKDDWNIPWSRLLWKSRDERTRVDRWTEPFGAVLTVSGPWLINRHLGASISVPGFLYTLAASLGLMLILMATVALIGRRREQQATN